MQSSRLRMPVCCADRKAEGAAGGQRLLGNEGRAYMHHTHLCTLQPSSAALPQGRLCPNRQEAHDIAIDAYLQVLPPNLVKLMVSDCPKAAPLLALRGLQLLVMQASTMDAQQLQQVRVRSLRIYLE